MSTLARVVDPEALSAMEGPSARLEIRVPASWAGRAIQIAVPARVACSRCDGGGCDGCGKSGAFKLAGTDAERTVLAVLPPELGGGVALRLVHPFGEEGPLEVLLVEVRPDETPSDGLSLARAHGARPRAAFGPVALALALAVIALVLVVAMR